MKGISLRWCGCWWQFHNGFLKGSSDSWRLARRGCTRALCREHCRQAVKAPLDTTNTLVKNKYSWCNGTERCQYQALSIVPTFYEPVFSKKCSSHSINQHCIYATITFLPLREENPSLPITVLLQCRFYNSHSPCTSLAFSCNNRFLLQRSRIDNKKESDVVRTSMCSEESNAALMTSSADGTREIFCALAWCHTFTWAPRVQCRLFGWGSHDMSACHRGGRGQSVVQWIAAQASRQRCEWSHQCTSCFTGGSAAEHPQPHGYNWLHRVPRVP